MGVCIHDIGTATSTAKTVLYMYYYRRIVLPVPRGSYSIERYMIEESEVLAEIEALHQRIQTLEDRVMYLEMFRSFRKQDLDKAGSGFRLPGSDNAAKVPVTPWER